MRRRRFVSCCALAPLIPVVAEAAWYAGRKSGGHSGKRSTLRFLDATQLTNKPNLASRGIGRASGIYQVRLTFPNGLSGANGLPTQASVINEVANGGLPTNGQRYFLDIEGAYYQELQGTAEQAATSVTKHQTVHGWAKAVMPPDVSLGWYEMWPTSGGIWDYIHSQNGRSIADWHTYNERCAALVDLPDVWHPSFYCWEANYSKWVTFVDTILTEYAAYDTAGKQIIPFLWHIYADWTGLPEAGTAIDMTTWYKMLHYLESKVSEVIFWHNDSVSAWAESSDWWKQILRVLNDG